MHAFGVFFGFEKNLFPVKSKVSFGRVFGLVSFQKGCGLSRLQNGLSHIWCLQHPTFVLLEFLVCVYRSNGSWKSCLLLIQKSPILVALCRSWHWFRIWASNQGCSFFNLVCNSCYYTGLWVRFYSHIVFNELKNIIFSGFFLSFPKNVQGKNSISAFQCNNVKHIFCF